MSQKQVTLESRIHGSFLGIAIGDALGMPVETMTARQILDATQGSGISGYVDPIQHRIKDSEHLKRGSTTDDTQLSLAVARSLMSRNGFSVESQAYHHVLEMARGDFGWGRSTRNAITELALWFESGGAVGRKPLSEVEMPPNQPARIGTGNGVAMKIVPLALWHFANPPSSENRENFLDDALDLGLMTHGDPRASFAAVAVGAVIAECLNWDTSEINERLPAFVKTVKTGVLNSVIAAEKENRDFRPNKDTLSRRLAMAFKLLHDPERLLKEVGNGCFALESVPFAIATFLRHPTDFRAAVLEAVNAGGDADTTASMVGAMSGALLGQESIPEDLIQGLRKRDMITDHATAFHAWIVISPDFPELFRKVMNR